MKQRRDFGVVIVGASVAGVSAAQGLRDIGFTGRIIIVGAEARLPYDRPPLSKDVLAGRLEPETCFLRDESWYADMGIEVAVGSAATRLDVAERVLTLEDESTRHFDGLVIATGASPIRLPGTAPEGVYVMRTIEDSVALRSELAEGKRLVVVGGGFIGAEVASTAAGLGVAVTMIEAASTPMSRMLGITIGDLLAALHSEHGVDVRCGVAVQSLIGRERVTGVQLTDGSIVDADFVLVGIGVRPATEWLNGSGLEVDDGVLCDAFCRTSAAGIVAAGDVARWPHPRYGSVRIEHWENAVQQGHAAAVSLIAPEDAQPFAPVPYVWSDQYDERIQIVGRPAADDELVVVDGSFEERRFAALYLRDGELVAGIAFNRPSAIRRIRKLLASKASSDVAMKQFVELQA